MPDSMAVRRGDQLARGRSRWRASPPRRERVAGREQQRAQRAALRSPTAASGPPATIKSRAGTSSPAAERIACAGRGPGPSRRALPSRRNHCARRGGRSGEARRAGHRHAPLPATAHVQPSVGAQIKTARREEKKGKQMDTRRRRTKKQ